MYKIKGVVVYSHSEQISFVLTDKGNFVVDGIPETSDKELKILKQVEDYNEGYRWFLDQCEYPPGF
jgi:hypothetical protein